MRILCRVSYDGTNYGGWQIQNNVNTVQGEIQKALEKVFHETIQILGSSRTDAGVHAEWQYFSFQYETTIPVERITFILNDILPKDIKILQSQYVEDCFHPIRHSVKKTYRYTIDNRFVRDPLARLYSYHVQKKIDENKMIEASKYLIGEHDFMSFCVEGCTEYSTVRTIESIRIERINDKIMIQIIGNGFLHNMVRIIVGTLIQVGIGRFQVSDVKNILLNKNRKLAGPTVGPEGLVLEKIELIDLDSLSKLCENKV